jgi:hypothetical protein
LSLNLGKVGDVRLAAGDRAGALAAHEESLAIRRKLAATDPENAGWQRRMHELLRHGEPTSSFLPSGVAPVPGAEKPIDETWFHSAVLALLLSRRRERSVAFASKARASRHAAINRVSGRMQRGWARFDCTPHGCHRRDRPAFGATSRR